MASKLWDPRQAPALPSHLSALDSTCSNVALLGTCTKTRQSKRAPPHPPPPPPFDERRNFGCVEGPGASSRAGLILRFCGHQAGRAAGPQGGATGVTLSAAAQDGRRSFERRLLLRAMACIICMQGMHNAGLRTSAS